MERPLLDLHQASLLENGVTGYDRDALAEDCRPSVLRAAAALHGKDWQPCARSCASGRRRIGLAAFIHG